MYRFFAIHKKTFFAVAFLVLFGATVSFATPDANTLDPDCAPTDPGCFPVISGGGAATWGTITGTLSENTTLQNALNAKQATITAGSITNTQLAGSIAASKLVGTDIATVGTITTGNWQGTAIADSYIASAATWNAKQNALTNPVTGTGTSGQIAFWNGAGTQTSNSAFLWDNTQKSLSVRDVNNIVQTRVMASSLQFGTVVSPTLGQINYDTDAAGFYITTNGYTSVFNSSGGLSINSTDQNHTLDVNGNIGIATGGYLHFSAIDGVSGYGIRDNAGTIQYKNAGGSWSSFGGGVFGPSGAIQFNNGGVADGSSDFLWDNTQKRLSFGRRVNSGVIDFGFANPLGALVFGYASDNALIQGNASGSFAFGRAVTGGVISANGDGSQVFGVSNGGQVYTNGQASLVFGTVDNDQASQIYTAGNNSLAFGFAGSGASLYADGTGAFTSGYASGNDGNGIFSYINSTAAATARGYATGGGYINAAGQASLIHGTVDGSDGNSNVSYLFAGESAQVFGTVFGGAYMSANDRSLVFGTAQGADVNGNLSYITTGSDAGFSWGTAFSGSYITTSGVASQTFGYSDGADINGNVSYLQTDGSGSFTFGNVTVGGYITSTNPGSLTFGYVNGGLSHISNISTGGFAGGYATNEGAIVGSGLGSSVFGYSSGSASLLTTTEDGAFAFGFAGNGGVINSSGSGSFAGGLSGNAGSILADDGGSFAFGFADDGTISAFSQGAFAGGYADGGNIISSTNRGAFSFGNAEIGSIINDAEGGIAIGGNIENYSFYGGVFGRNAINNASLNSFLFSLGGNTTTLADNNTFAVGYDGGIVFKADSTGVTANTLGVGGILSATLPSGSFGTIASFGANGGAGLINIGYEDGSGISSITGSAFGPFQVASSADNNILINPGGGNVGIGTVSPNRKLDVAGNIGIEANGYLNFDSSDGSSGYGIRDNAGSLEYKNSGGSWNSFGTTVLNLNNNQSLLVGGSTSTTAELSIFIGANAGALAPSAHRSNFVGEGAGQQAEAAGYSNFFGTNAGYQVAPFSTYDDAVFASNFFGYSAGSQATYASYSNFFGMIAGQNATNASFSNFFGPAAGRNATNASFSNFIGVNAGDGATNASNSNLFGLNTGFTFSGNNIGSNNIIIGTNISLPNATTDAINLGGILFGTGTYSTTSGNPSIAAVTSGKIGIAKVTPAYTLDVGNSSVSGIVAQFTNSSGSCTINPTTTSLSCSSDRNLKKNISPLDTSIYAKVLSLVPVQYSWNNEQDVDSKHTGFIAQDVEVVFPDLISTDKDTGLKALNYVGLIPYTIKAVQELDIKINSLSNLVDSSNTLRTGIALWLGDTQNGIQSIFAKEGHFEEKICIGQKDNETCITKETLDRLLQQQNQGGVVAPTPTPVVTPDEPVVDIVPAPEIAPVEPVIAPENSVQ